MLAPRVTSSFALTFSYLLSSLLTSFFSPFVPLSGQFAVDCINRRTTNPSVSDGSAFGRAGYKTNWAVNPFAFSWLFTALNWRRDGLGLGNLGY